MTTIYVQFSDDTDTVITALFGAPQDPETFPNQGEVDSSDPRYVAYYDSMPEWARAALPTPTGG